MPETLKQLQSRRRTIKRQLQSVEDDIAQIKNAARATKLKEKLTSELAVPADELDMWPDSLLKRFEGGLFRIRHTGGGRSLYAKTKTGILWHYVYRGGRATWERVAGQ